MFPPPGPVAWPYSPWLPARRPLTAARMEAQRARLSPEPEGPARRTDKHLPSRDPHSIYRHVTQFLLFRAAGI